MIQIYCHDEDVVNDFLEKYQEEIEIINTQLALNELGSLVMVTYKTKNGKRLDFSKK